ncbi:hypothetical protein Gotur_024799 [Gossypium turneri]
MKILAEGPITTPKYTEWLGRMINDNISRPSQGNKVAFLDENCRIRENFKVVVSRNSREKDQG